MSVNLPAYYTSLAPFRELFRQGTPILTFHKLGPRPPRVRLKGLYVEAALFARQLVELREAGFKTVALDACRESLAAHERRVALTFDDGFCNVLENGLASLAATRFHAIQFLAANFLGKTNEWDVTLGEAPEPIMDAAQVREWLAAGHAIGSHTLTHPFLTRLPAVQAREEITASRKKLEDLFGVAVEHFCYPYGDWNNAVRDLVAEAGYHTACTTEFGVNPPGIPPLALKRITARYRSRNWKDFKIWLAGLFAR
jgi:peptidoglycan/xylan/chitin deacetylase (PgdA/CDA1 family)